MHPAFTDLARLRLHVVAWALAGALLGPLVHLAVQLDWTAAILFALPLGIMGGPIALSAWYVCRSAPLARTGGLRVVITATVAALVSAALWFALGRAWWAVLRWLGLDLPDEPSTGVAALLVGVGGVAYLLALTLYYMVQANDASAAAARSALEAQIAQRDAELRALRAQVDPHFLFNSLNSINALIVPDPGRARHMCQLLADFLRESLRVGTADRLPLASEIALTSQYLGVEQVRFGSRLGFDLTIGDGTGSVSVPPLILQPLVENAVRHGIATCLDGGVIAIETQRGRTAVVITVANPRDAGTSRRGTGFGLEIVRRRLTAAFGERASLAIAASPDAYQVTLTIPLEDTSA